MYSCFSLSDVFVLDSFSLLEDLLTESEGMGVSALGFASLAE